MCEHTAAELCKGTNRSSGPFLIIGQNLPSRLAWFEFSEWESRCIQVSTQAQFAQLNPLLELIVTGIETNARLTERIAYGIEGSFDRCLSQRR
jgi:hypothetical protein